MCNEINNLFETLNDSTNITFLKPRNFNMISLVLSGHHHIM